LLIKGIKFITGRILPLKRMRSTSIKKAARSINVKKIPGKAITVLIKAANSEIRKEIILFTVLLAVIGFELTTIYFTSLESP